RLFAPEHGFRGEKQDMEQVTNSIDADTGLPLFSLYGSSKESLVPAAELFRDLDILLVDLPDIGTRYYTFAQSLAYCMQTAAITGTKVVVLDRPNPVNGVDFEGARLSVSCRSFCGYAPVANRHGLTLGELALAANRGFGEGDWRIPPAKCDLEIQQVRNWHREDFFDQTGLPWVLPSPNMPALDTALVYPGACLFEATAVSEGRGTTRPFELLGAPYIDGRLWAAETQKLNLGLNGVMLRPTSFIPKFNKWAGSVCGGLQIHVTGRRLLQPFRLGIALLYTLAQLYPDQFSLRAHAYEFVDQVPALDLLYGSSTLRSVLEGNSNLDAVLEELAMFEKWYAGARRDILIY
ncbi:MAG TPA: DUF1343 domain-containing protein, partial [Oligoflexia bacterium]|nr:DUF1343 domain-containing protein [Oligoflexia bacterium]